MNQSFWNTKRWVAYVAAPALAGCVAVSAEIITPRPFVIAHYMHCYVLGAISPSDARVRNPSILANLQTWPQIDQESEWFTPDLSAISASGSSATVKDFENAERAGIDAFGLLVGPKHLPYSRFSGGLNLIASVAEKQKIKIIPELWADPWATDYELYGERVKQFMDAHPLAFQKWNGKPMFTFEFENFAKHSTLADQSIALQRLAEFLAPWGGFSEAYVIFYISWNAKQDLDAPLFSKANAVAIWTPQDDWSATHSTLVSTVARALRKDFVYPVSPAFYQRRAGGKPMEYGNSFGAAKYIDAWRSAIMLHPVFVEIQTWNDFSEDSALAPTNTSDNTFLELSEYFTLWAKNGTAPTFTSERVMLFHPKQLQDASIGDPTALVTNAAWRHNTPTVDYLDVVTLLTSAAKARLSLADQAWEETIPPGLHEWIIYVPQQVSARRSGEVVAGNGSYPGPTPERTITIAHQFSEGTPQIELTREGRLVAGLKSKVPFLSKGSFQDFTVIGDESILR